MKKTAEQIIIQIRELLDELEGIPHEASIGKCAEEKTPKKASGCSGAIQDLINEGFFKAQKTVAEVVTKLKEEGQPYSNELVSMNLLNLVKPPRKILRRIKENNQWCYIVRT